PARCRQAAVASPAALAPMTTVSVSRSRSRGAGGMGPSVALLERARNFDVIGAAADEEGALREAEGVGDHGVAAHLHLVALVGFAEDEVGGVGAAAALALVVARAGVGVAELEGPAGADDLRLVLGAGGFAAARAPAHGFAFGRSRNCRGGHML